MQNKPLHTLIPFQDFKSLMGIDDREEKTARFCLVTSTLTIEQYCKRRFLQKKHFESFEFHGDLAFPLSEYPVIQIKNEQLTMNNGEKIDPAFYCIIPDCDSNMDFPYSIEFSPVIKRIPGLKTIRVVYLAGYAPDKVPADLAAACMELAAWNMNRYRGRRIGMTGNIRGNGKDGEHFELSMPENVRGLLEPYKRKMI